MTTSLNLEWKNGVIGRIEDFYLSRFPVNNMWARALGTTLTSNGIHILSIKDKMGPVRANVWFTYISDSGLGFKTPLIDMTRKMLNDFDKNKVSISKFTPEGYTEWVEGTDERKDKDGNISRKTVHDHPVGTILRDEFSVVLGENKASPAMATQKEYLSKLWDGYIEGYYTRKCQFEGNIEVYVSLCAASSKYFYDLLDKKFFEQGTGNRIMWITQEKVKPNKLGASFFFADKEDEEFETLKAETTEKLRFLENNVTSTYLDLKAAQLWCDFQYEYNCKAVESGAEEGGSFSVKLPLNCLKLAMNYSASCLSVDERVNKLLIREIDMKRAIHDVKEYEGMWKIAMKQWEDRTYKSSRIEKPLETATHAMRELMRIAISQGGTFCMKDIVGKGDFTYTRQVSSVIGTCVAKDWVVIIPEESLTPAQVKQFTHSNNLAQVFKVTKKGLDDNQSS